MLQWRVTSQRHPVLPVGEQHESRDRRLAALVVCVEQVDCHSASRLERFAHVFMPLLVCVAQSSLPEADVAARYVEVALLLGEPVPVRRPISPPVSRHTGGIVRDCLGGLAFEAVAAQ